MKPEKDHHIRIKRRDIVAKQVVHTSLEMPQLEKSLQQLGKTLTDFDNYFRYVEQAEIPEIHRFPMPPLLENKIRKTCEALIEKDMGIVIRRIENSINLAKYLSFSNTHLRSSYLPSGTSMAYKLEWPRRPQLLLRTLELDSGTSAVFSFSGDRTFTLALYLPTENSEDLISPLMENLYELLCLLVRSPKSID